MLRIADLNKTYPSGVKALDRITLNIGTGIFGLLGPNGAGKSSLMRTLATLQEPDSGSVFFGDIDVLKQKETMRGLIGYLPQEFGVYPRVSAEDMLHHLAILKGLVDRKNRTETVNALLKTTNLFQHRKKHLGGYSGGMKQRFGIAQALLGNPKILIIDEPTAGLDPGERERFHYFLSDLSETVTVILSTHIVSDVNILCNDLAIMHEGRVLIQSPPEAAIKMLQGKIWKIALPKHEMESYAKKYRVVSSRFLYGKNILKVFSDLDLGDRFEPSLPDLEDVYFSLIHAYTTK